jgi:hypothetical protein
MTYASTRTQILYALRDRLALVKTSNGWPVTVNSIFVDEIPMGLDLEPHQLPALIVMDDNDMFRHEHQALDCAWKIEIQLVLEKCPDSTVHELARNILKAIFAGTPTGETNGGFRFHPAVTWVELQAMHSDLHMIEANRMASIDLVIHYRTKPWNL